MSMLTDWLLQSVIHLGWLIPLAWLLSRLLRHYCNARTAYAAWLLLLPAVLPLPQWPSTFTVSLPAVTVSPGSAAGPASGESAAAAGMLLPALLLIWAIGALLMAAFLLWRQGRFELALRRGREGGVSPELMTILRDAGVPGWLPVRRSRHCEGPMLLGVLYPRLYLPSRISPELRAHLHLAVAHEMAHLRHGDSLWNGVLLLSRALFWFHPLVHLVWFRIRRDQELAADESALALIPDRDRVHYARLLCASSGLEPHQLGFGWMSRGSLRERIMMIADSKGGRLPWPLGLSIVFATVFLSGMVIAGTDSDDSLASDSEGLVVLSEVDPEKDDPGSLRPIVMVSPTYPREAVIQGIEGYVVLEATVRPDIEDVQSSQLVDIQVVEAEPQGVFEEAAREALSQWRVSPLRSADGERRPGRVRQTMHFRLDED